MLLQENIINEIQRLAGTDERIAAAMLYGSFVLGESDRYSDVDCILFIRDEDAEQFDRLDWAGRIAPVALFYRNEFGNWVTVFDTLVRAEFHFYPAGEMPDKVKSWQGNVFFPNLESTILVDKTGELTEHLQPLIGPPPDRNTPDNAQFLTNSFLNWILFGVNVLARGEYARASEILHMVQDYLLRMVRVLEGTDHHWYTPARAAEQELSVEAYSRFIACSAAVERDELWKAYLAAWEWGCLLLDELARQHVLDRPDMLIDSLRDYIYSLLPNKLFKGPGG